MRFIALVVVLFVAIQGAAEVKEISDQLVVENLSFPAEKLSRFLAATDNVALIHCGAFHRGLAMPAPGKLDIRVGKNATQFDADYAIGRVCENSKLVYRVLAEGKELWKSGVVKYTDGRRHVRVKLDGVEKVTLEVEPAEGSGPCDGAMWGEIEVTYPDGVYPDYDNRTTTRQLGILTPAERQRPRVNGASVYGVRPGHPIIYRVPVTGKAPVKVEVTGADGAALPQGLTFDASKRQLGGSVAAVGEYRLRIRATNAQGSDERIFTLKVGDKICLTPAMGWNSWNAFGPEVTEEKIRSAAEAMVSSGLADHGWSYVNIDDFWERNPVSAEKNKAFAGPPRDKDGRILANAHFKDMRALADFVHSRGLKIGLYSSPGPFTCGKCAGSLGHEEQDARTYAEWGFDYLKYDWCSCQAVADDVDGRMLPFMLMGSALHAQNRDIVYSFNSGRVKFCPSRWARCTGANSWRVSGDIFDTWTSITAAIDISRNLYFYAEPGAWNDPDMLCVGPVRYNNFNPSRLSPNEQYTHISMWAMMAAPLMIGCDMTKLDGLTYSLLSNDEVIDIDQDPLGKAAGCIDAGEGWEIWARPLADGSIAVAMVNMAQEERQVTFDMEKAGILCKWRVRDCWRQEDIGVFSGDYSASVPGHATQLVRFTAESCGRLREGLEDVRDAAWKRLVRQPKYLPNHANPWRRDWPVEWQP